MHIVLVYNLLQLFSSRGSFSIVLIYNLLQPIFSHGSFYIVLMYNFMQLIFSHGSLSIIVYTYRMCYHYYCRGTYVLASYV